MIFIASIMVGNGIYIGPCTIRQYCALFFFVYCFVHKNKLKKYTTLMPQYILFIFMYGISCMFDGMLSAFLRSFISLYLVSIVAYSTTILVSSKYKTFNCFCDSFIIIGLLNAVVNLLQYTGSTIGFAIGGLFIDINDEVQVSQFTKMVQGNTENLFGIMGNIVYNGYYCMILPFIILYRFPNLNKITLTCLIAFSLTSLFVVGERSCFGITLLLLIFFFYIINHDKKIFYLLCFLFVIVAGWLVSDLLSSDVVQNSRWMKEDTGVRSNINRSIIPYIFSHILFGGLNGFINLTGFPPHNVIASGFIYSGFVGGLCIIYILFYQSMISIRLIKQKIDIPIILAFLSYTLNGLLHNPAIVTGDAMVWILWAMVYYTFKNQNKKLAYERKVSPYICNNTYLQR